MKQQESNNVHGLGMDTGDMILKEEVEIGENETTGNMDKIINNWCTTVK